MLVFFDTEFTGLYKDNTLISIGLISEDGKEFYAEINDLDVNHISDWVKENVLNNTISYGDKSIEDLVSNKNNYFSVSSNSEELKNKLSKWFSQFKDVQLVSDVCHYDMVLLINIFGTAFDLPDNVSPVCYDINQDIARFLNISNKDAFDLSREDFLSDYGIEIIGDKHNSLYDAKTIKEIYNFINV